MDENTVQIAVNHYENFPVGSFFLRKRYREAIRLIYVFARVADDFADEGMLNSEQRIEKLQHWGNSFHQAVHGDSDNSILKNLANSVKEFDLPVSLFDDLLAAFRKDAVNPLYQTHSEVLEYCTYSANPIGRLLLRIFECSNKETERLSDTICTALQLTNFWQDISVDTRRNRFYIAREEFEYYRLCPADLSETAQSDDFIRFMKSKVQQTRALFESGKPLFQLIHPHFRFELKLTWHGGMRILEKIEEAGFDTRHNRPVLGIKDKFIIFIRALQS